MNNELRRARLLADVDIEKLKGLEVRPLASPIVPRATGRDIVYADRRSEDDLARQLPPGGDVDPTTLVHIDHVWDRRLVEVVGADVSFNYVVAAHVIEHAPNLLGWLREVGEVLTRNGRLLLVVPDRRFTYDFKRRESTLGDALAADILDMNRPDVRQVVDAVWNGIDVDLSAAWAGDRSMSLDTTKSVDDLVGLCKLVLGGEYVDVHCWVFTPASFARLMKEASEIGLVDLACDFFVDTAEGEFEFCVSLIAGEESARVSASWRTMEWDAGRKATSLALKHARRAAGSPDQGLLGTHDEEGRYLAGASSLAARDLTSWLSTNGLEGAPAAEIERFWQLATETWRLSHGLTALSGEHEALAARLVARNGFRPSSWDELVASIDEIRVRQLGAFGNSVIQIMNARDLAGQLGVQHVVVTEGWFLPTGISELHGGVRLLNQDSSDPLAPGPTRGGVSILGNFFRSSEFDPILGVGPEVEFERLMNGFVGLADIDDLSRLVNAHLKVGVPLPDDHLVMHVRSGDIFRDANATGYGQPPLAYYCKVFDSRPWAAVSLVFEDEKNPVIAPLLEYCRRSSAQCDVVSGRLEDDVAVLLRARTLVAGRGTFMPAVAALSQHAQVVYCFDRPLSAVGGKRLTVKRVVDVKGEYVGLVMNYNWSSTAEQRSLMVDYPVGNLAFEDS